MKIIDVINKIADNTLPDGFEFEYDDIIWKYFKSMNSILMDGISAANLEESYNIFAILNDDIDIVEERIKK